MGVTLHIFLHLQVHQSTLKGGGVRNSDGVSVRSLDVYQISLATTLDITRWQFRKRPFDARGRPYTFQDTATIYTKPASANA